MKLLVSSNYFIKKERLSNQKIVNYLTSGNSIPSLLCAVHVIFEMFLLASNIEIVVEIWMFIYFLLFGWGKFNQNGFTYL